MLLDLGLIREALARLLGVPSGTTDQLRPRMRSLRSSIRPLDGHLAKSGRRRSFVCMNVVSMGHGIL
jgi:hypothetical protein